MAAKTRSSGVKYGVRQRGSGGEIPSFGRSTGPTDGALTDLGCPDCRGVLATREEGKKGHLRFTCQIGHGFSQESLIAAKEEQLENSLWSCAETYEEIVRLHEELATRASGLR